MKKKLILVASPPACGKTYVSKLIDAGFEVSEEHSTEKLVAYTKESVVNGETKTLCVKLVFAADYLSGMQFVIYPSVI